MSTKPSLKLALRQTTEVAALAALRQPYTADWTDIGDGRDITLEINAARLAGRVSIMMQNTDKNAWSIQKYEKKISDKLALLSLSKGELVIENVRHDANATCFEIFCTVHPDPIPGYTTSKPPTSGRIGIPDTL